MTHSQQKDGGCGQQGSENGVLEHSEGSKIEVINMSDPTEELLELWAPSDEIDQTDMFQIDLGSDAIIDGGSNILQLLP